MVTPDLHSVDSMTVRLESLLERARQLKTVNTIEPPLPVAELIADGGLYAGKDGVPSSAHNAIVETAARNLMYNLLATRTIDEPSFIQVWNLLDIIQIFGDRGHCDPALVFWLVEELLDSQSIDGCRKVFDFLESRRERLVAKDFLKNKNLVVLRSCNELLRRLSRAEDAVFCGRVFIFLFQSFPLGDRSSVNLRGEFHVENATTFEEAPSKAAEVFEDGMEVDKEDSTEINDANPSQMKADVDSTDKANEDAIFEADFLYPTFWKLQQAFSNPTRLFAPDFFEEFKKGLEATVTKFRNVPKILEPRPATELNRGTKRKRDEKGEDFASNFNPKYLTSRDLFKLELSDHAFQRHILVQALILVDFLLSLTDKAKKKLGEINAQKALQYPFTLGEQDAEWAVGMKNATATYLQDGPDGKFYYRMVDTVLSRDKNWVRWKMEACPPIFREPVSAKELNEGKGGAQKATASKRLKNTPLGSLSLDFLSDEAHTSGLDALKNVERYAVPAAETVMRAVENNELDLEMATPDQESTIQEAKMSNTWRVLRVTSKSRLNLFDKIDDGKQLKSLFQPDTTEERETGPEEQENKISGSEADKSSADTQVDLRPEEVMQVQTETTVA